jgi:hypothetical protein
MTKFRANDVDDFMDNAGKKYGDGDLGDTDAKTASKYGGFKDGKLQKLVFTCDVTVDYAEPGSGKADAANKDAIDNVADIAKAHELKHKAGYEKAFKDWDQKTVAKKLMDQTFKSKGEADKAVKDALDDLNGALKKACLELHKKEGIVEVSHQADGSIKIVTKAAGAAGCA